MSEESKNTIFNTNLENRFKPQDIWGNECHCSEPELNDELRCKNCNGIRKEPFKKKKEKKEE